MTNNDIMAREADFTHICLRLNQAIHRETVAIVGHENAQAFALAHLEDPSLSDALMKIGARFVRGETTREEVIAASTKLLDSWKEAARKFVAQKKAPQKTVRR